MGKMQRDKGSRVERLLRDYLRGLGYKAERVPLSGASSAFKGDVVAYIDGKPVLFECKARARDFSKIYALYDSLLNNVCAFHNLATGKLVTMSYDFERVRTRPGYYEDSFSMMQGHTGYVRTINKIVNLSKLLGTADYLVIKGDNKPFLFFHYVGAIL